MRSDHGLLVGAGVTRRLVGVPDDAEIVLMDRRPQLAGEISYHVDRASCAAATGDVEIVIVLEPRVPSRPTMPVTDIGSVD